MRRFLMFAILAALFNFMVVSAVAQAGDIFDSLTVMDQHELSVRAAKLLKICAAKHTIQNLQLTEVSNHTSEHIDKDAFLADIATEVKKQDLALNEQGSEKASFIISFTSATTKKTAQFHYVLSIQVERSGKKICANSIRLNKTIEVK